MTTDGTFTHTLDIGTDGITAIDHATCHTKRHLCPVGQRIHEATQLGMAPGRYPLGIDADGKLLVGETPEDELTRLRSEVKQLRTRVADRNASLDRVTGRNKALTAELAKVEEQLTAANRRADGLEADLNSAQRGLTAYANQTAAPNTKPDGPWKALIVHEGWAADDFSELGPEDEVDIVIVRDSALPDAEGYMSGTYKTDDVAFTAEDIYVDGDGGTAAPTIYARAQVMADGLNAAEAVATR